MPLVARPAGIVNGVQYIWCPNCDESCPLGPCAQPLTAAKPEPTIHLEFKQETQGPDPRMDIWRMDELEELAARCSVSISRGNWESAEPWLITGLVNVRGRSLRDAVDLFIGESKIYLGRLAEAEEESYEEDEEEDYEEYDSDYDDDEDEDDEDPDEEF